MSPRTSLPAALVCLSLAACARPGPAVAGGPREDVWIHDGQRARRAIVERDDRAGVLTVVWTDPAPRPNRDVARELRWVFAGVEPPTSLRFPDGQVVEHPDAAEVRTLEATLDATGDVEAVLAGLPRLARLGSRGRVLARAAAIESLHPAAFDVLLAAVTTERAQQALGRGPGGIPAGGDPTDALAAPLVRLAGRAEVGPPEARALLQASNDLPRSSDRAAVLLAILRSPLAPVDPVDALATAALLAAEERHEALAAIATRLPLDAEQAATVLAQARQLQVDAYQAEVLVALVGKVDEQALLDAAAALRDPDARRRVLDAVDRRD